MLSAMLSCELTFVVLPLPSYFLPLKHISKNVDGAVGLSIGARLVQTTSLTAPSRYEREAERLRRAWFDWVFGHQTHSAQYGHCTRLR